MILTDGEVLAPALRGLVDGITSPDWEALIHCLTRSGERNWSAR